MAKKNSTKITKHKKEKEKAPAPSCAGCNHLRAQIEKVGLKPVCLKKKYKFKERDILDWKNDKDINSKSCEKFEVFVPQIDTLEE